MPSLQEIAAAEEIALPLLARRKDTGNVLHVTRVGGGYGSPYWLETNDGALWRIPRDLDGWAREVTSVSAAAALFPCRIEFGRIKGRAYAEFIV